MVLTTWRIVRLFWDRLNVVIGWPLLLLADVGIAWSGVQSWKQARDYSNGELKKIWNRHTNIQSTW